MAAEEEVALSQAWRREVRSRWYESRAVVMEKRELCSRTPKASSLRSESAGIT
jgi:hypothetical protein